MIEHKVLDHLREGLQSGALIPDGVHAKIIALDRCFEVADQRLRVDAMVEFTVPDQPNKSIKAVIEVKSHLTPMLLEGTIHQILRYRNELHRSGMFEDLYPMVAAPYISDSVQRRCKDLGVGYVDLNGTFALIHGGVYIDVVRPATMFKNPQGVKNVFLGKSRRIIRVLLANSHKPYRLEQLASETQLSVGQVSQITRRLQDDGLLDRTSEGCVLNRPRKLLMLFAQELKGDYIRKRKIFNGFSEKAPAQFATFLHEICERKGIRHAFTLASGLEPNERNVREDLTAAYISTSPETLRDELQLDAVGKGANVILMTPPDADDTESGGVFYRPRKLTNGLTGVNPVQLYVDFRVHSGRGDEQAEFLIEHSLGFRS